MGSEKVVSNRNRKECCELQSERDHNSKRTQRRKKKMSVVQRLYETCKEVFASGGVGYVPPPSDIQRLRSVLDSMTEADVGLMLNMPYFQKKEGDQVPIITYLHLHKCEKFSIGIFCLPPTGVIPLHNHPGMTVFSKILFGTMHIKSYDWAGNSVCDSSADADGLNVQSPEARLARVKVDSDFTAPCDTSILYPADGGNMHCFTALTACAVLDVLGPPYSDPDGRHCAYYPDFPFSRFSVEAVSVTEEERESCVWLQELERPEDLIMVGAMYTGPKIVKD